MYGSPSRWLPFWPQLDMQYTRYQMLLFVVNLCPKEHEVWLLRVAEMPPWHYLASPIGVIHDTLYVD